MRGAYRGGHGSRASHLLKVNVAQRYIAGDARVREIYSLNLRPISNYTCYVVMLLLALYSLRNGKKKSLGPGAKVIELLPEDRGAKAPSHEDGELGRK